MATGLYRSGRSSLPSFSPIPPSALISRIARYSANISSVVTRILLWSNNPIGSPADSEARVSGRDSQRLIARSPGSAAIA